jgi:squalene synthase HpnC
MARAGTENFPVASRLLPRAVRRDLLAIYGFARLADELGDEADGDRLAHLAWLESELALVFSGTPGHALLRRLVPTVRAHGIPPEPFRRLIEANRQDQRIVRYATASDLLRYCELSANPVGHLVLHVFGAADPERLRRSDAVCTGLQLIEHWQDVAEDYRRGRVYVPQEDLHRFGCTEEELGAPRASPALRRLLAFEVERARSFLVEGSGLVRMLRGRAKVAVAGFAGGGLAALEAIQRADHDVLAASPRASRGSLARAILTTLMKGR